MSARGARGRGQWEEGLDGGGGGNNAVGEWGVAAERGRRAGTEMRADVTGESEVVGGIGV